LPRRLCGAGCRRQLGLQMPPPAGLHDLPVVPVHPARAHLERLRHSVLRAAALSGGAHAMSTVNGIAVEDRLSAVRELLRQRAVALGLCADAGTEAAVSAA